jgi:uncharacterized protein
MRSAVMRRTCAALSLVAMLLLALVARAQLAVPPLSGHVTDQTATLTAEQQATLEQTLLAFEARKGTQLAILMVPSTAPEAIEPFALRVAEQWKLGRKNVDDGAILVVAKDDRTLRIEVGYGLEGALSDVTSKRIIEETILPRLKQGDYYGGMQAGVESIIQVVDGEPLPPPASRSSNSYSSLRDNAALLFVVALAVGGVLRSLLGRGAGAVVAGAIVGALAWFVVGAAVVAVLAGVAAMVFTLIGGGTALRGLGGLGGLGGGSRGGGLGGLGGGGFRGGGGGFGGGGASGRW